MGEMVWEAYSHTYPRAHWYNFVNLSRESHICWYRSPIQCCAHRVGYCLKLSSFTCRDNAAVSLHGIQHDSLQNTRFNIKLIILILVQQPGGTSPAEVTDLCYEYQVL